MVNIPASGSNPVKNDLQYLYARLAALQSLVNALVPARYETGIWFQTKPAASQTNVSLLFLGAGFNGPSEILMTRAGSITGIALRGSTARISGTLTAEVTKNGAGTGLTAVLDGTNTQSKVTTQAVGLDTYAASDRIGVRITTDAGWTPLVGDIGVHVEVQPSE